MVIQGDFFRLTPSGEHSLLFDLELLHTVKGKTTREEYKIAGYGIPLESAIKKCIQYALNNKFEVLSLKEYLYEYKKMQKELELYIEGEPIRISKPVEHTV